MIINFTKMHGLGNDFVVIDAIHQQIALNTEQIRLLADRHFGIGCDQLLIVEQSNTEADFRYRIFNADGSEVAQCGNGARCFARFVRENNLSTKDEIWVDTDSGSLILHFLKSGHICVKMGVPKHRPEEIPLQMDYQSESYTILINDDEHTFGAVSMGNPHAVIQVDDVSVAPVNELGPKMENHAVFPQRANIGFMQIIDRQHIALRVYERGAAETLACGSGACAAVVIGIEQGFLDNSVNVHLPGGKLDINWQGRGKPVYMSGPATSVFKGTIDI